MEWNQFSKAAEMRMGMESEREKHNNNAPAAAAVVWFFLERWDCTLKQHQQRRKEWETNTIPALDYNE